MATLSSDYSIGPAQASNATNEYERNSRVTGTDAIAIRLTLALAANTNLAITGGVTTADVIRVEVNNVAVTNYTIDAGGNNIQFTSTLSGGDIINIVTQSTQDLPGGVFTSTTNNDNSSDNFNHGSPGQGTYISPNVDLTLTNQANVIAGTMKIGANNTSNGGRLIIDGSTLTVNRLATAGNVAFGGTQLDFTNSSTAANRPTLLMRNGAILNMMGQQGQAWRGFLGNQAQGRLLLDDCTINFSNVDAGDTGGNGTARSNAYLGFDSTLNNVLMTGMNKIELLGAILEFNNVTLEYTVAPNSGSWVQDGALFLAGQTNIIGTLGNHEIIVPSTYTFYPSSGSTYFSYAALRNKATGLTIDGTVTITQGTTSFNTRCHDLRFVNSSNSDLTNFFIFQNTLELTAARFDTSGTSLGDGGTADTKVAMMDNRDLLQMDKTHSDFTSGSLSDSTYTWYQIYKRSIAGNRADFRVPYGFPTGKAAAFRGATDGSGVARTANDASTARIANNAYQDTSQANTTLLILSNNLSNGTRLAADTRRFYPFRVGYHQWGYIPEYVNSGLGTEDFLGNSTVTKGNLISAETSPNDVRDGKMVGISTTQDNAIGNIALSAVNTSNISFTNPTGSSGTLQANVSTADVSLNKLHQNIQRYAYNNFNNSTATITSPVIDGSNDDAQGDVAIATDADAANADEILFFTETTLATDTTSVAANSTWSTLNYVQFNSSVPVLIRASGSNLNQEDNTTEGYLYIYRATGNWGFFSYTREWNEGNSAETGSTRARITHIASEGNIGSDGDTLVIQRSGSIDGTSFAQAYPIRSYLWDSQVQLKPSEYIGENVLRIRRMILAQSGASTLVKTTTGTQDRITTVDLELATDELRCGNNTLEVDVTGAGGITGITTSSTSTAPAIIDGVTVGSGITITFVRGQTYYIAGDISAASFATSGSSGNVTLVQVGNGALPSSLATNFVHQKIVTVSFVASGNNTWSSSNITTDERVNIAAFNGTSLATINPIEPVSTLTGALSELDVDYNSGTLAAAQEWQAIPTGDGGTGSAISTLPDSWDWSDTSNTDRPNPGFKLSGISSTEGATLTTYFNGPNNHRREVLITDGGSNWAIYNIDSINNLYASNVLTLVDLQLLHSSGAPVSTGLNFYFSVNTSGDHFNVSQGSALVTPTATISNSNQTLNYAYTVAPNENLYYAFAARDGSAGNWYIPVSGNTEDSDTVTHTLVEYSTAIVPTTVSSATGMSAQVTYINTATNDVVQLKHEDTSATNHMEITINDDATSGSVTDGNYIHRLVMQKDNFLQNAAAGTYPVDGYSIGQTEVTYNNRFVTWQKDTSNNNVVGFSTAVVDSGRSSINSGTNAITTTNVQTLVSFNPAATNAFVPSADLDTLNVIDRTTKATLGQVL